VYRILVKILKGKDLGEARCRRMDDFKFIIREIVLDWVQQTQNGIQLRVSVKMIMIFYYLLLSPSLLRCVSPIVTIATVLTNDSEMFQGGLSFKEAIRTVKRAFHPCSDHLALAWLYREWESLLEEGGAEALRFSQRRGLNNVNMKLISSRNKNTCYYSKYCLRNV
jgi:hypothetical protein